MLRGETTGVAAVFGVIVVAFVVVGIVGVLNGALVDVNNQLGIKAKKIANTEIKHVIKECFVRESGMGIITEEFLQGNPDIETQCKIDDVHVEVELLTSGKTYTFGGTGSEGMFVPIQRKKSIEIAELRVSADV